MDAITRHRLKLLALEPGALARLRGRARLQVAYRRFLAALPYENLSSQLAVQRAPGEPAAWPRGTDLVLRELVRHGLGGTSFSLAYTLCDLLRGLGAHADCALGHNLVTEEGHAVVLAWGDDGPWLYDPSLLLPEPVPCRPGAVVHDALGRVALEARCGSTLTLRLQALGEPGRAIYSLLPAPAPPDAFRQAWVASFHRGRPALLRIARRVDDEIRRYGERPATLELLRPDGRVEVPTGPAPVDLLHRAFGIDAQLLRAWFARATGPAV